MLTNCCTKRPLLIGPLTMISKRSAEARYPGKKDLRLLGRGKADLDQFVGFLWGSLPFPLDCSQMLTGRV